VDCGSVECGNGLVVCCVDVCDEVFFVFEFCVAVSVNTKVFLDFAISV